MLPRARLGPTEVERAGWKGGEGRRTLWESTPGLLPRLRQFVVVVSRPLPRLEQQRRGTIRALFHAKGWYSMVRESNRPRCKLGVWILACRTPKAANFVKRAWNRTATCETRPVSMAWRSDLVSYSVIVQARREGFAPRTATPFSHGDWKMLQKIFQART